MTFASWLTVIFMHSFFFCFLAALCMEICPSSFVLFSCYYNSLRIPPFISPWLLVFRQVTRTHIKFAYYWGGQPIRQSGSSSFPKRLFIFFLFCIYFLCKVDERMAPLFEMPTRKSAGHWLAATSLLHKLIRMKRASFGWSAALHRVALMGKQKRNEMSKEKRAHLSLVLFYFKSRL